MKFNIDLYTHKAIEQEILMILETTILKSKEKMILSDSALNHLFYFYQESEANYFAFLYYVYNLHKKFCSKFI